jgi:hypothetical protein
MKFKLKHNADISAAANILKDRTHQLSMVIITIFIASLLAGASTINTGPFITIPATAQQQQQGGAGGGGQVPAKPVDGYNSPQGHVNAIRHVFDDPALRVQHYCKPSDKIVLVCQLYDTDSKNATLIGIEYIITADQYKSLPDREKPNWHYHKIEFRPDMANPMFPELNASETKAGMQKLMDTYGKVIITWNPKDKLPAFPAQVEQVQHPFMVNATAKPEVNAGSFNQTLKY